MMENPILEQYFQEKKQVFIIIKTQILVHMKPIFLLPKENIQR